MITVKEITEAQELIKNSRKTSPYIEHHIGVLDGMRMAIQKSKKSEAEFFLRYIQRVYGE